MTVLIGCSGWAHGDWVRNFYPLDVAKKKEEWLRYYSSFFNTVEINTTFDREPNEYMISGWISKGRSLKNFDYSLTLPSRIFKDVDRGVCFEEWCLSQLKDGGVLGCAVIQTPEGYSNNAPNREYLRKMLDVLDLSEYSYAVEFRDSSWFGNGLILDTTKELLAEYGIKHVLTDEYQHACNSIDDNTYVRLRGNCSMRSINSAGCLENEVLWIKKIIESSKCENMRIYFENETSARCIYDALHLMDLLKLPHRLKNIGGVETPRITAN